ncbi:MAG: mechanosensitive ion channel family protein [Cellvibrionaceae bacterium]
MEKFQGWAEPLVTVVATFWEKIAVFLPSLLAAVVVIIVGYLIAKILHFIVVRLLNTVGLNTLSIRAGIHDVLDRAGIKSTVPEMVGKLVFWIVLLTFFVSAAETLGLSRVSSVIDELTMYLPKVIGACLILIVGFFLANLIRDVVRGSAESIGVEYAKPLSSIVFGLLCIITVSLVINQLKIETTLLNAIIAITAATLGLAVAISLGFGTRDFSKNVVASVYARDLFKAGDKIKLEKLEGEVIEVSAVKTLIKHKDGSIISVPNTTLIETTVNTRSQSS